VTDLQLVIIAGTQLLVLFGQNWLEVIKLNWVELHNIQLLKMLQLLERHALLFENIGTIQGYNASKTRDKTDL